MSNSTCESYKAANDVCRIYLVLLKTSFDIYL